VIVLLLRSYLMKFSGPSIVKNKINFFKSWLFQSASFLLSLDDWNETLVTQKKPKISFIWHSKFDMHLVFG
jgi:hypothetical protein